MNAAYYGAKKINNLGLPVFFIVGNHDLYYRHTRDIHSVLPFMEFDNFHIIEEPTIVEYIGNGALLCPFLFHEEYPLLAKYVGYETWWGHFEFRGFIVTGCTVKMPTGPNHQDFTGPKHIISGHFHKRQAYDNVVYVGNPFPTNFGDVDDNNRGMMTYDHNTDEMLFFDWEDCPKYSKVKLSDLLDNAMELHPNSRVKCMADISISFEESTYLRQTFTEKYNLREFSIEESHEIKEVLSETATDIDWTEDDLASVNELVIQMLEGIDSQHINNQHLIDIYRKLNP